MSSRVREFHLPMTVIFGGAALLGLVLCVVLALTGVDLGLNLSIVGLLLGLLVPIGIEIRSRSGRTRNVVILDYRTHQFGHAVARGVTRALGDDKRRWKVSYKSTNSSSTEGATEFQQREIQAAVLDDVDALVLIPAEDNEALWFALAAAIKANTFVVVIDTKPPNRIFRDVGIEPPRFVSANYGDTGVIVGATISDWMSSDPSRRCVLWIGPFGSWPGEERSRNVIFELARRNLLDRTVLYPITSWTPDAARCRETLDLVDQHPSQTAVYVADDENAVALHLLTLTERPGLRARSFIVGCNGTSDDWGNIPSVDMRAVDATVDILAEEQGVQAAMLMIKERNMKLDASERSVYIRPHAIIGSEVGRRWVDAIFDPSPARADHIGSTEMQQPA